MGRLVLLIAFFAAFIVFAMIKLAAQGVGAAYSTVFDPENAKAKKFLSSCDALIIEILNEGSRANEHPEKVLERTAGIIFSMAQSNGFNLTRDDARKLVNQRTLMLIEAAEEHEEKLKGA